MYTMYMYMYGHFLKIDLGEGRDKDRIYIYICMYRRVSTAKYLVLLVYLIPFFLNITQFFYFFLKKN